MSRRTAAAIVAIPAVALAVLLIAIPGISSMMMQETTVTSTVTVTATPTVTVTRLALAGGLATVEGDGLYEVSTRAGQEATVRPGVYVIAGPADAVSPCQVIIRSDEATIRRQVDTYGPVRIRVREGDAELEMHGCQDARRVR